MLPLLQLHRAVQPPANLDPLAAGPVPLDNNYTTAFHHLSRLSRGSAATLLPHGASYERSFPIRTSQSAVSPASAAASSSALHRRTAAAAATRLSSSRFGDRPEHQLRRKTPSGTIDAGYDGSPAQLAPGPPPLKHMIIPAVPGLITAPLPRSPADLTLRHPVHAIPVEVAASSERKEGRFESFEQRAGPYAQFLFGGDIAAIDCRMPDPTSASRYFSLGPEHGFGPGLDNPAILGTSFHHTRPGPLHAGPFCPPPPPAIEDLSAFVSQSPHSSNLRYGPAPLALSRPHGSDALVPPPFNATGEFVVGPRGAAIHRTAQGPVDKFATGDRLISVQISPRLEGLSLGPGREGAGQGDDPTARSRFREKALTHAHRAYMDLLAHLNHTRKHSRSANAPHSSPKILPYPKPPKHLTGVGSAPRVAPSLHARAHSRSNDLRGGAEFHIKSPVTSRTHGWDRRLPAAGGIQQGIPGSLASLDTAAPMSIHPSPPAHRGSYPTIYASTEQERVSPISNARSSLEMLNHLCEQSGWKWVDGMLLGGCLHYGLERYEEALEWFSRIVTIDPGHVEAISNTAATLYCLNRQADAEQHWLKAIKMRPQYLEAVEHLVGLLYKKRGEEAVDIINYVQNALRLPDREGDDRLTITTSVMAGRTSRSDTSSNDGRGLPLESSKTVAFDGQAALGFGSSGYAIPGNENGRMLALVHAKGTMLYSLKEVDRASEAFEEAVLISAGRHLRCIQNLVRRIQAVLAQPEGSQSVRRLTGLDLSRPLLLHPERARHTAQLVFSGRGDLPGLRFVPDGSPRRAAVQTTSNALLSLAKIFQDSMSNGNVAPSPLLQRPSGVGDILALYYLSLSLQESPSTANNVGILLASVQQSSQPGVTTAAEQAFPQSIPGIVPGSGLALALAYYNYGLRLDPKHVHLHTNLGSLLKDLGHLDLAIQMYQQAVSCDETFDIALTNLANAVKDRGRISDAIGYYKRAVAANPEFAEAVCGLATALNSVCDWRGRGGVIIADGRFDRWHVGDDGMLHDVQTHRRGSGLMQRVVDIVARQLGDSSHWGHGVLHDKTITALSGQVAIPDEEVAIDLPTALRAWAGQSWEGSRVLRFVERATRSAMRRWYHDKYLVGVESPSGYSRARIPSSLTVPSAPTVLPFHTFTSPLSARDIRRISQRNALRISCSTLRSPWLPSTVYPPPAPPSPYLKVGYVSSDFNNHPLAHLMQSVFGLHKPSRVKAYCYATTASDRSVHRQQIEREAPVFRDVSNWPSDKLVNQIVKDGIHILVNLNGYTRGARNEIFAARPAPIQMSFMGFAGTLGAEWCDYILADTTAIPVETLRPWRGNVAIGDVFRDDSEEDGGDWVYSENIIFCRDTFFCCDHAQSCDKEERGVSWEEEQSRRWRMRKELFPTLADDAIILGNFNQLYKIDPTTFRTWLRILSNVPRAVLWLLRFPELGEANLRRTAKAWAGSEVASRILFTDVAPKHLHISRARVCDLFLDTPECNAHTTSADVLWSSTPLLTLPRYPYKMCSRMAASILKGALPKGPDGAEAARDLIAIDEDDYEKSAIRLARELTYTATDAGYGKGNGRLAELRKLLFDNKWTCALFDTRRWVADLEEAYEEAWRRWVAGDAGDIYL